MKKLLGIKIVLLYISILLGFLYPLHSLIAAVEANRQNLTYDLIDDFSFINQYSPVEGLNPYWQQAQDPLWNTTGFTDPGDIAYHTNYLGYYVGSGPDDGIAKSEPGGFRSISWDDTKTRWWFTLLSIPEKDIWRDISNFYYLSFRIRGKQGGEIFYIKIETKNVMWQEKSINQFLPGGVTTDWQTVKIPISAFNFPPAELLQAKAVSLVFYKWDALTPKTIYFDDIVFMPQDDPVPPASGFEKPQSTGPVQIELDPIKGTRKIIVDNQAYRIRGLCYQPAPIGQTPEPLRDNNGNLIPFEPYTEENCERDFPIISGMGTNTLRTWALFMVGAVDPNDKTLLDKAQLYGLRVFVGFWVPYEISFLNEWAKGFLRQDFNDYVTAFNSHPALLAWVIGNENNYNSGYNWHWYDFANTLAKDAYLIEADKYHPVAIIEADIKTLGDPLLGSDDEHLEYIDIIGFNVYRGKSFTDFFDYYSAKTEKPLWISEFGNDAWFSQDPNNDPSIGYEDPLLQTEYDVKAHIDIERNKKVCLGGTLMAYSDEWWKDPEWRYDIDHLTIHDFGGYFFPYHPDLYANEEWWGIVAMQDNGSDPDLVFARDAVEHLYSNTIGGRVDKQKYPYASKVKIEGPVIATTNLDVDGLYYFTQLLPGIYSVMVLSEGYTPPSVSPTPAPVVLLRRVVLEGGDTLVVDF